MEAQPCTCRTTLRLQAVLSYRFRAAVRVLRALGAWEGLLSRALLLGLALGDSLGQGGLVGGQLVQYVRAAVPLAGVQPHTAVARLEAVAEALPAQWFAGGPPREAASLVQVAQSLAGHLVAVGQGKQEDKSRLAGPAARLAQALQRLGMQGEVQNLQRTFSLL
jgi:hypothetical protein